MRVSISMLAVVMIEGARLSTDATQTLYHRTRDIGTVAEGYNVQSEGAEAFLSSYWIRSQHDFTIQSNAAGNSVTIVSQKPSEHFTLVVPPLIGTNTDTNIPWIDSSTATRALLITSIALPSLSESNLSQHSETVRTTSSPAFIGEVMTSKTSSLVSRNTLSLTISTDASIYLLLPGKKDVTTTEKIGRSTSALESKAYGQGFSSLSTTGMIPRSTKFIPYIATVATPQSVYKITSTVAVTTEVSAATSITQISGSVDATRNPKGQEVGSKAGESTAEKWTAIDQTPSVIADKTSLSELAGQSVTSTNAPELNTMTGNSVARSRTSGPIDSGWGIYLLGDISHFKNYQQDWQCC
ncbi:hypothetical protein N7539_008619 [Penicillium diatomitis]|uniref:Uncharacterized protein n=1 Tax=Penicillium diatomitis TaxID=2819901 RepID=A0A9W9WQY2_9EURO|nr:uncharacterized protein N7539_008619 [Penicillium diatomitis]KAJ5472050.1 hypothetical protein N7539_008619 [Penicillium diatomitis]